jgi:hypothetical protein
VGIKGELKMIVVGHHRDCDGTPLYILSFKPIGFPAGKYSVYDPQTQQTVYPHEGRSDLVMGLKYGMWAGFHVHGIGRDSFEVCPDEFIPLKYEDIYEYEEKMRRELAS